MAARTSWNPRTDRAPEYLDDDAYAYDPAYDDDLLNQGFDEYGRLTRRRPARGYDDAHELRPDPRGRDDLRRAVDSLARQVEAATRQSGRPRLPAPPADRVSPRAQNVTLEALDRLEARLEALNENAQGRAAPNPDERAKVEATMERHFAALDQRIAALHDLARGKNVDVIRDDLVTLGDRIDGLATSGNSVSGSIDQLHEQLGELRHRLESDGWTGANALTSMQDRLDLITDKLSQLELTPSALSAVERGYSHILERVSRIEQLAGQNVVADDLWDRLDTFRDEIVATQSNDGLSSLESRISGLADNIETLATQRGHDPAIDRLEMKLADMARTIGIIRDRRDLQSGSIEARLADITARIDKVGQDRGRIDFTPVERQIASLAGRIDRIGEQKPDVDLTGLERQFAELGGRIEEMLSRPEPVADDRPAFDSIENRLSEMQSRLEDVFAASDRPQIADPSEALTNVDKRLGELHARLDDLTLSSVSDQADLTPIATRLNTIDDRLNSMADDSPPSGLSVDIAILSDKLNLIDQRMRETEPSNPDLPILLDRLGAIERNIETAGNKSADLDLGPLADQLNALDKHLRERQPAAEVDLQPVSGRLESIEARLEDLMASAPADTRSLTDRLEAIDRRFDEMPKGAPDLSPLNEQLVAIDRQLRGLTVTGSGAALDWSPITERLDSMDRRLADNQPGEMPDLAGLQESLAAIDERLDGLAGGSHSFAAADMPLPDMSVVTDRLQAIEERISGLAAGSSETTDISPVTDRLHAIEKRLADMPLGGAHGGSENDRLVPLLETFEAALRKISTHDDISALTEKVTGLHTVLDGAGDSSALDEMADLRNDITYLRRELRSMPMMAESEDGAGLGTILADIKDRLDRLPEDQPVTFRDLEDQIGRVVRTIETGDADGGALAQMQASLAVIESRLESGNPMAMQQALADLPEDQAGEGAAAIVAVAASIESSISELRQATAASDEDTRHALDSLNATMEAIVGRMAHLEAGGAASVAEPAYEETAYAEPAYEEPAYEEAAHEEHAYEETVPDEAVPDEDVAYEAPAASEQAAVTEESDEHGYQDPQVAEPEDEFEIPEISIGAYREAEEPAESYQEPAGEASDTEMPADDETAAVFETADSGFENPQTDHDTPESAFDTAAAGHDADYDAPGAGYDTPEAAHEAVDEGDQDPAPEYDSAVPESSAEFGQAAAENVALDAAELVAEPAFDTALPETALPEDVASESADQGPDEGEADAAADLPPNLDAGTQSILGRLTSSQILKRATGGRADSFTPEADDQPDQSGQPETLLEPGTDSPMDSALQNAPSSDTALMSGESEAPESRTRQGAGLGDLAAASGLGFDGEKDDQGNQFLSAARRAARAAVMEGAGSDAPAPDGAKPAVRKKQGRSRVTLILLVALIAAAAFAGYKYWRGELQLDGLSIGGFTLTGVQADDAMPVVGTIAPDVQMTADASDLADIMAAPTMAEAGDVELQSNSADASIAFGAPESAASEPIKSADMISSVIAQGLANMPSPPQVIADSSAAEEQTVAIQPIAPQSVGNTASVPETVAATKADLTERTENLVAAALAGAKTRSAALPKPGRVRSYVLPVSIGSAGLRQAALADIPQAQFEIASRFADGSGVNSDLGTAAVWYEKAARGGLAPAQFRLGSLYEKGKGVPLDRVRAAELYETAAATGNAKAMHNLAVLYAEGGTGDPDLVKAARWFRKAAEHGVRDSQFNVGILYARGLGVPKDLPEAYKWFAIAAKSGDRQAAKRRDTIAASMTNDELAKALSVANIFQPIPLQPQANIVIEPRGGWAAAAAQVSPSGRALVSNIQSMLAERGFEPGPADGMMGRRTAGAIEAFQMEVGLPVTGNPDLAVLSALKTAPR